MEIACELNLEKVVPSLDGETLDNSILLKADV